MSNLKHLISLACFLVGSSLLFGQSLTITPSSGTYTPNSTQTFTIQITGAESCQGLWNISATSSSNYSGFVGETNSGTITIGTGGTGSTVLSFSTPPSGELVVDAMATKAGCLTLNSSATLTAVEIQSAGTCDDAFSENFDGVAVGTGFTGNNPNTNPVSVGQGTAGFADPEMFSGSSYFEVVSGNRMEGNDLNGEMYWESNDILISPCCSRTISVDIFGVNGEVDQDYVEVYYAINKVDISDEVLINRMTGTFSTTVSISSCNLPNITEVSNLKIIVRVFNDDNMDNHGFDNVIVTAGTQVEAPQVLNISCSGDMSSTTVTVDAVSECSPEFSFNGGVYSDINNTNVTTIPFAMYPISVRDASFPDCGITSGTIMIDAEGACDFVLPITLLDFYGRAEADAIGLYWTTSSELNNDYMAVERSLNGIDFEEIGKIAGNGTTFEPQQYTFIDNYPVPGTNYYRLRQVDYDGAEQYHPVIAVLFDKQLEFAVNISPNPARETLQIDWSLPGTPDGTLRIFDMQGQLMEQRTMAQGSGRYNLPIQDLPAGMYVLQMEQEGKVKTLRFVKD